MGEGGGGGGKEKGGPSEKGQEDVALGEVGRRHGDKKWVCSWFGIHGQTVNGDVSSSKVAKRG